MSQKPGFWSGISLTVKKLVSLLVKYLDYILAGIGFVAGIVSIFYLGITLGIGMALFGIGLGFGTGVMIQMIIRGYRYWTGYMRFNFWVILAAPLLGIIGRIFGGELGYLVTWIGLTILGMTIGFVLWLIGVFDRFDTTIGK